MLRPVVEEHYVILVKFFMFEVNSLLYLCIIEGTKFIYVLCTDNIGIACVLWLVACQPLCLFVHLLILMILHS